MAEWLAVIKSTAHGLLTTASIHENINMAGGTVTDFYLRYYVGHRGKFGHEFLEFEFRPDGKIVVHKNS